MPYFAARILLDLKCEVVRKLKNIIYELRWLAIFNFEDFSHKFLQISGTNIQRVILYK